MKREKGQARANSKCQGGNLPCHPSPLHPLPLTSQLTGSSVQSFPAAPLATCSRNFSRAAAPKGLNSVSVMRIRTCRGRSRGGGACADADKEGEEEGVHTRLASADLNSLPAEAKTDSSTSMRPASPQSLTLKTQPSTPPISSNRRAQPPLTCTPCPPHLSPSAASPNPRPSAPPLTSPPSAGSLRSASMSPMSPWPERRRRTSSITA